MRIQTLKNRHIPIIFIFLISMINASAQSNPVDEQGIRPFASLSGGNIDSVDLMTGKLNINIPLVDYPQRGGNLRLGWNLSYISGSVNDDLSYTFDPVTSKFVEMDGGNLIINAPFYRTYFGSGGAGSILAGDGAETTVYAFPSGQGLAADGSGYFVNQVDTYAGCPGIQQSIITSPNGVQDITPSCSQPTWYHTIQDRNGNQIHGQYVNGYPTMEASWQDSVGRIIPSPGWVGSGGRIFPGPNWNGWTNTTDYSGCTGPLPTTAAIIWSIPGVSGGTTQYKFCGANIITQDLSLCPNPWDSCYQTSGAKLQSIVLPNGTSTYTFEYDTAPQGSQTTAYGDLIKITLPTGGKISYTWVNREPMAGCPGDSSPYGGIKFARRIATRTVDPNDGTPVATWTYGQFGWPTSSGYGITSIQRPDDAQETHYFGSPVGSLRCSPVEKEVRIYSAGSSNNPIKRTTIDYIGIWNGDPNGNAATGVAPVTWTEYLDDGKVWKRERQYSLVQIPNLGNLPLPSVKSEKVYTTGAGSPGPLVQQVLTDYKFESSSPYSLANLILLPSQITTSSPSASNSAVVNYRYDEDNGSPQGVFGNLTSTQRQISSSSSATTQIVFDAYGNPISQMDPNGNVTTLTYDSNHLYAIKQDAPSTSVSHQTWFSTDFVTGKPLSVIDENGNGPNDANHQLSYSYDSMLLTVDQYTPAGGHIHRDAGQYALPITVTTTISSAPSPDQVAVERLDGLARPIQSLASTGADWIEKDTCYDGMGRVSYVSYPFTTTGLTNARVCPGQGSLKDGDRFEYDALGRTSKVTHSDGSFSYVAYTGLAEDTYDESGHHWIKENNVLGQLVKVLEPDPSSNTPTLETDYAYDAIGNLISVSQGSGTVVRKYTYDGLSRLTKACNPEALPASQSCNGSNWSQQYTYHANGNVESKTDSRGVTVNYSYDALNRLVSKTYSNDPANTPSTCYQYDSTSVGYPNGNFVGRLAHEWTQSGACSSSLPASGVKTRRSVRKYDAMGRVKVEERCVLANCTTTTNPFSLHFEYDLAGNLTEYDNGVRNLTLSQKYDATGRLNKVTSSAYDATHPNTLYSVGSFFPNGVPYTYDLGLHLNTTQGLDNRLRPTTLNVVVK